MKTIQLRNHVAAISGMLAIAGACTTTVCQAEIDHITPYSLALTSETGEDQFDGEEADFAGGFTYLVALGDSYSAGTGLSSDTMGCFRNDGAWPQIVASTVNGDDAPPTVIFPACSGARTADITGPITQNQQNRGVTAPQLDVFANGNLPASTLITLTIGGNDAGLERLTGCFTALALGLGTPADTLAMCTATADDIIKDINVLVKANLLTTFTALKNAAPTDATIVAVGYPHTMPVSIGMSCTTAGWDQKIPLELRTKINDGIDLLNAAIAQAASDAGIYSVTDEVVAGFAGREVCADGEFLVGPTDPMVYVGEAGLHPNADGNVAYAYAVLNGMAHLGLMLPASAPSDAPFAAAGSEAPSPSTASQP